MVLTLLLLVGVANLTASVGLVALVMWLAGRFVSAWLALGIGIFAVLVLGYGSADIFYTCGAEPVYVPPKPGDPVEGTVKFACDGPMGLIDYFNAAIICPIAIVAIGLLTFRFYKKSMRAKGRRA
jgi:hypothetical protein